jgi:hypothetical protein
MKFLPLSKLNGPGGRYEGNSTATLCRWAKAGQLPPIVKIGGKLFVEAQALDEMDRKRLADAGYPVAQKQGEAA